MNDTLTYALYLAYVGKHLLFGESVFKSHKKVYLVLIPSDLSERHQSDVKRALERVQIPYQTTFDLSTLKRITNREILSYVGVTEQGLAKQLQL
jgi:hypothetical protein